MLPANLQCPRGQHRVYQATAKPPMNVSGWTFAFTVRTAPATTPPPASGTVLFQATTAGGQITITDVTNGVLQITLSESMTLVNAGNYFFDLWRIDVGFEDQLAVGNFQITPSYYQ